eukprot:UN33245
MWKKHKNFSYILYEWRNILKLPKEHRKKQRNISENVVTTVLITLAKNNKIEQLKAALQICKKDKNLRFDFDKVSLAVKSLGIGNLTAELNKIHDQSNKPTKHKNLYIDKTEKLKNQDISQIYISSYGKTLALGEN